MVATVDATLLSLAVAIVVRYPNPFFIANGTPKTLLPNVQAPLQSAPNSQNHHQKLLQARSRHSHHPYFPSCVFAMWGVEHGESFIDFLVAHLSKRRSRTKTRTCPTTKILSTMPVFSPQHRLTARPVRTFMAIPLLVWPEMMTN